jgi:segregation and condensation protein B
MNKLAVLEGLLFIVGDDGLTLNQMMDILEISNDEARDLLNSLKEKYEQETSGIRIHFLGNTFKLTTKKEHKEYFQKLIENEDSNVLSQAALETLAIVAYNQPITRAEVNEIRGVDSGQMIRKLVAKGLMKETGRSDQVGRPILYATTSEFLDYFGLSTIEDLPKIEEFTQEEKEDEETDLYHSKYQETDYDVEVLEDKVNE